MGCALYVFPGTKGVWQGCKFAFNEELESEWRALTSPFELPPNLRRVLPRDAEPLSLVPKREQQVEQICIKDIAQLSTPLDPALPVTWTEF